MLLLLSTVSPAAEVDQFSMADQPLRDSGFILEQEVNRRLMQALEHANYRVRKPGGRATPGQIYKPRQCREQRLYQALQWQFARPVIGQLESYAEQDPSVDRDTVSFERSVYRDFLWPESPSLVLSRRMSAVINIQGVELGTDKLGHFFTEGFSYFETTDKLAKDVEFGLHFGRWTESLYFGAQTTGVFSYADLVANLNGLRFWNRILARHEDPLTGQQVSAYVECHDKQWRLVEPFSWQPYVDLAWNETINCSALRTQHLLAKVLSHKPVCRPDLLPRVKYQQGHWNILNDQGLRLMDKNMEPEMLVWEKAKLTETDPPQSLIARLRSVRLSWEAWRQELTQQNQP